MAALVLLVFLLGFSGLTADSVFQEKALYTYSYIGEIRTGREDTQNPHFSGFGFRAELQVYVVRNSYFIFKFEKIQIGQEQNELPRSEQRFSYNGQLSPEETEFLSKLELPFGVHYLGGMFKFFFNPTPSEINFRKAVISLFQLSFAPSGRQQNNFTTTEDSLFGRCSAQYYPVSNSQYLSVKKVRLHDTCEHRPKYFFTTVLGYQCHLSQQQLIEPLVTQDEEHYTFDRRPNKNSPYTLSSVSAESIIRFTPYTVRGQAFTSEVRQELTLSNVDLNCASCHEIEMSDIPRVDTLTFQFHHEDDQHVPLMRVHIPRTTTKKRHTQPVLEVQRLLKKLPIQISIIKEFSNTTFTILELLRQFDYTDFVDIFSKFPAPDNSSQLEQTKWILLLEILPFVGTNPSLVFIANELIEKNKINNETANDLLSKSTYHVKEPTFQLFNFFLNFTKSTLMDNHYKSKLWRTAWLGIGILVHRGCVDSSFNTLPAGRLFMSADECDQCLTVLMDEFKHRSSGLGIEYLRAIGNTFMFPKAYNFFVDLTLSGKPNKSAINSDLGANKNTTYLSNSHFRIRNVAIAGIIPFMHAKPKEIASIVHDIFHDENEDEVIRIHAFDVLMWSRPTREFFLHLIPIVNHPRNNRISSYIYNTVVTFSKSKDPARQRLVKLAKEFLPMMKSLKAYDSLMYSQDIIYTAYNGRYNFGHANQFYAIPSRKSIIPREIYFHESMNFMNHKFDIIELGYIAENESPFDKFSELFLPRALSSAIQNITSKRTAEYDWYIKSHLHDVLFDKRDDSFPPLSLFFKSNTNDVNLHTILYNEVEFVLPNSMGFPVVIKLNLLLSFHAMGSGNLSSTLDVSSNAQLDMEFTMNAAIDSKMYVEGLHSYEYGYEVTTGSTLNLPLNCSCVLNSIQKNTNISCTLPTSAYNIFQFNTDVGALFPVAPYKFPTKRLQNPFKEVVSIGHDYFGIGLNVEYSSSTTERMGFLSGLFDSFRETASDCIAKNRSVVDHYYAAVRGALGYSFLNPEAYPFQFGVSTVPLNKHSTNKFQVYVVKQTEALKFADVPEDDGTSFGQRSAEVKIIVIGAGTLIRTWTFVFRRTSVFPPSDNLNEFVLNLTSKVVSSKQIHETLDGLFHRYKSSFQHSVQSSAFDDNIFVQEKEITRQAFNLSYYTPSFGIVSESTANEMVHYPNVEIAIVAEEVHRWVWRTAFKNFYSVCVITSTSAYTFDGFLYQVSTDGEEFQPLFGDCLNQDVQLNFRNVTGDAALRLTYRTEDYQLQKLEFLHPSRSGGVRILQNDSPILIEDFLPIYARWAKSLHDGRIELYLYSDRLYIESRDFDFNIIFDKDFVLLLVSNSYRGRQCGMCGNMDRETHSEFNHFKGRDNKITSP